MMKAKVYTKNKLLPGKLRDGFQIIELEKRQGKAGNLFFYAFLPDGLPRSKLLIFEMDQDGLRNVRHDAAALVAIVKEVLKP